MIKAFASKSDISKRLVHLAVIAALLLWVLLSAGLFSVRAEDTENYEAAGTKSGSEEALDEYELKSKLEEERRRWIGETDFSEWDGFLVERAGAEGSGDDLYAAELVERIAAYGFDDDPERIVPRLIDLVIPSLKATLNKLIGVLIISFLSIFCGIVFKGDGMQSPVATVLSCASVLCVTAVFSELCAVSIKACGNISSFCVLSAPPLAALLIACGCSGSSAILVPKLPLLAGGISSLACKILMPLLTASGVISVLSGISDMLKLSNAVKLIHKTVKWILGLASTVYSGVILLGGLTAGALDGIKLRSIKYAVGRLIPAADGIVSGSIDAAASGALIVKNAAGTAAIVILAIACLRPLLSVIGGMLAFRVYAAVCEPLSNGRSAEMLSSIADTLSLMLACCACAAAMLALTLAIIISIGGAVL